ncbi:MAG: transketolase C-terminal domain-containing protein, partial [archaeon]
LRLMIKTMADYDKGPIAVRYPRGSGFGVELTELKPLEIGKGEVIVEGTDLTIVAVGGMVKVAVDLSSKLKEKGIQAEVINARFVKPLDKELLLKSFKKTGKVLTMEDNVLAGGFGSAILELIEKENLMKEVTVKSIGYPDEFIEHGTIKQLHEDFGLTAVKAFDFVLKNFEVKK